jgi:hypothetical protein
MRAEEDYERERSAKLKALNSEKRDEILKEMAENSRMKAEEGSQRHKMEMARVSKEVRAMAVEDEAGGDRRVVEMEVVKARVEGERKERQLMKHEETLVRYLLDSEAVERDTKKREEVLRVEQGREEVERGCMSGEEGCGMLIRNVVYMEQSRAREEAIRLQAEEESLLKEQLEEEKKRAAQKAAEKSENDKRRRREKEMRRDEDEKRLREQKELYLSELLLTQQNNKSSAFSFAAVCAGLRREDSSRKYVMDSYRSSPFSTTPIVTRTPGEPVGSTPRGGGGANARASGFGALDFDDFGSPLSRPFTGASTMSTTSYDENFHLKLPVSITAANGGGAPGGMTGGLYRKDKKAFGTFRLDPTAEVANDDPNSDLEDEFHSHVEHKVASSLSSSGTGTGSGVGAGGVGGGGGKKIKSRIIDFDSLGGAGSGIGGGIGNSGGISKNPSILVSASGYADTAPMSMSADFYGSFEGASRVILGGAGGGVGGIGGGAGAPFIAVPGKNSNNIVEPGSGRSYTDRLGAGGGGSDSDNDSQASRRWATKIPVGNQTSKQKQPPAIITKAISSFDVLDGDFIDQHFHWAKSGIPGLTPTGGTSTSTSTFSGAAVATNRSTIVNQHGNDD